MDNMDNPIVWIIVVILHSMIIFTGILLILNYILNSWYLCRVAKDNGFKSILGWIPGAQRYVMFKSCGMNPIFSISSIYSVFVVFDCFNFLYRVGGSFLVGTNLFCLVSFIVYLPYFIANYKLTVKYSVPIQLFIISLIIYPVSVSYKYLIGVNSLKNYKINNK